MPPKISAAEWEVMNVVWAKPEITAVEVFHALPAGHGWKQKTVNTFLVRLVQKGALAVRKEDKAHAYRAKVRREACVETEGRSFLDRVFRGAAGSLVLHFCQRADLTAEELRELKQLLKNKGGRP